jgi:hypothetical protein
MVHHIDPIQAILRKSPLESKKRIDFTVYFMYDKAHKDLSEEKENHFFIFENLRFSNIKKWNLSNFRIDTKEQLWTT